MKTVSVICLLLVVGCSGISVKTIDKEGNVTYNADNRCTVQSSVTVLGIDVQVFDFMGNSSSPQKVRIGYVSSQQQVTPNGNKSSITKTYNLDTSTYDLRMNVDTGFSNDTER